MPGDAHLRASLTLDTNLEEAVRKASEGMDYVTGTVAKAQEKLKRIIEKGDPYFALKRQQEKEIRAVEEAVEKEGKLTELGELAKAKIVEKYARKRAAIEERAARATAHSASRYDVLREKIDRLDQPMSDMRGLMDSLGVATSSAAGSFAALINDTVAGFATGGAMGLAIAGTTALVVKLADAWNDSKKATIEAKVAAATNWEDANAAIEAQIKQVAEDARKRRLKLQGVSGEQIQADELVGGANLRVQEQQSSIASLNRQADALDAKIAEMQAKAASGVRTSGGRYADLLDQRELVTQKLGDAKTELQIAKENADAARLAAQQLLGVLKNEEAKKAAEKTAGASARGGGPDAIDSLIRSSGLGRGEKFGAAISAQAEMERNWRDMDEGWLNDPAQKQAMEHVVKRMTQPQKQAAKESVGIFASAGVQAGEAFASGLANALKQDNAEGILKGLLGVGGAVLDIFAPGAGTLISTIGGFFRDGGVPYALQIPQGRSGLAVVGGPNYDAKPAWLHKQEVVMPESVVNDTFGGLPNAVRVAAGGALPGRRGPGGVTVNVAAFDPRSMLDVIAATVEPAQYRRGANRQAAKLTSQQRRLVREPRMGR